MQFVQKNIVDIYIRYLFKYFNRVLNILYVYWKLYKLISIHDEEQVEIKAEKF